ncbi:MAG: hypothetical protein NVS3B20_15970 [Polyangiales bacterium]
MTAPHDLFHNDFMRLTVDANIITLVWDREEPSDDHSVQTAHLATAALNEYLAKYPSPRPAILVDLTAVKRNFPRATAAYATWLLVHRGAIRGGAFATKSFVLRAGISAAMLVPGLTMKGFSDAASAQAFVRALPA